MPIGRRPPLGAVAGVNIGPAMAQTLDTPPHTPTDSLAVAVESWQTDRLTVTADGTTNPVAILGTVPAGRVWLIDHVAVFTTSAAATFAILYDGANITEAFDFTTSGNRDATSYSPPIVIASGGTMRIAWTGGGGPAPAAGVLCLARVQYRVATLRP